MSSRSLAFVKELPTIIEFASLVTTMPMSPIGTPTPHRATRDDSLDILKAGGPVLDVVPLVDVVAS